MSSSAECWEYSGRKLPEKPTFSQTCSRLSRYLKEKGSFGDLSLVMSCKPDVNASGIDSKAAQDVKPKNDMFPWQSSFSSSSSFGAKEEVEQIKETKSVKQSAPLTIFYDGQVMMFDDCSAEKAKQVIDFASKVSSNSFTAELNNNQSAYTQNLANNQKKIASIPRPAPSPPAKSAAQEPIQTNASSLASELPIARRASLHRFLEKRKDRITSKAPYQIDGSTEASSKSKQLG